MILDTNHRVRMCNPAFERLFGYSLADIVGKAYGPTAGDSQASPMSRRRFGVLRRRERLYAKSRKRRRKDGTLVDVRIIRTPLVVRGQRIGSFAIYEDITTRSRAENAQAEGGRSDSAEFSKTPSREFFKLHRTANT